MSQVHHCHLWQVLAGKKKKKNLTVCNTGVPPKGVGRQILKATGTTLVHIFPLLCIYFPDEKVLTVVPDHSA